MQRRRGFTLIEILVVLGIIGVLAALIFPVFAAVRESGRRTSCASNLRQLGMAITLYSTDYDHYPRGLDPADKQTPEIWAGLAETEGIDFTQVPLLTVAMQDYVKNPELWHCPSDGGFDTNDITNLPLDARPTCYGRFGMSYFYRTELTFLNLQEEHLPNPAETNVLSDADGSWHGAGITNMWQGKRYNVLYGDSHVKNVDRTTFDAAWAVKLQ